MYVTFKLEFSENALQAIVILMNSIHTVENLFFIFWIVFFE